MVSNLISRFFPTPRFLVQPSFGLDISDESIKFVELRQDKKGIRMHRYGERRVPIGVIESGKIKNVSEMEKILISLRDEEDIRSVRVSLPEEQVYLFKLKLGKRGLENVREGIELSLEEYIPVGAQETVFDYEILGEDAENLRLEIAAIPKNVIEEYLAVFRNSAVAVKSFELESHAVARCVVPRGDLGTYMVADFGKKRTGMFIVSGGTVAFTSTLDIGGTMLSSMIAKNFKISLEEAEKKKKEHGLRRGSANTEIFSVLLNGVSVLRDEMVKHSVYWHTHKDEDGRDRPAIEKVILCGGDANLDGLTDYLSVSMKTRVELANVWVNLMDIEDQVPDIPFNQSLTAASALGLALGNFEHQ